MMTLITQTILSKMHVYYQQLLFTIFKCFRLDFTLKILKPFSNNAMPLAFTVCSSKSKRSVAMALRIEQTPAKRPHLSGESACWWEKHNWVLFPHKQAYEKAKLHQS